MRHSSYTEVGFCILCSRPFPTLRLAPLLGLPSSFVPKLQVTPCPTLSEASSFFHLFKLFNPSRHCPEASQLSLILHFPGAVASNLALALLHSCSQIGPFNVIRQKKEVRRNTYRKDSFLTS